MALLGATVARLTPDQKVACSNHVGVKITCILIVDTWSEINYEHTQKLSVEITVFIRKHRVMPTMGLRGATVARLTPDQKVARSNHFGVKIMCFLIVDTKSQINYEHNQKPSVDITFCL